MMSTSKTMRKVILTILALIIVMALGYTSLCFAAKGGTSYKNATKIQENKQLIMELNEDDYNKDEWFKFIPERTGVYDVRPTVTLLDFSFSVHWYDSNLDPITGTLFNSEYSHFNFWSHDTSVEHIYFKLKKGETYYIKTCSLADSGEFRVKIVPPSYKPGKSKITDIRKGQSKTTVKLKKVKKASQYTIQIRKDNSKWKTISKVKKPEYTFKTKKYKNCYIRVRASRKVDSKWYNGKWSKAKRLK